MTQLYTMFSLLLLFGASTMGLAQDRDMILEGYVFEANNRGYLNEVKISVLDAENSILYGTPTTNREGYFAVEVPRDRDFVVRASKSVFEPAETVATTKGLATDAEKAFVKITMERAPGYVLEVTLAEERIDEDQEVDAVSGATIEVYNNTTDKEVLTLRNHQSPYFSFQLDQGNHYTLLIRSPGYFTKRIESFINIDGCILCMDGVSEIGPGVSDNLAYGNDMGTLLANIELKPMRVDSAIALNNIYYDYNSANIREDAEFELDKVVELLRVNPSIVVELGSHTDSRGHKAYNRELSQKRADSAVAYIVNKGIKRSRLTAKGYGESTLVNDCFDNVQCSDEEHARNRRTELKITGFTNDPFLGKPLAEIITEENLESLLAEVMEQGEYQVPEDGTLPPGMETQDTGRISKVNHELEKLKGDLSSIPKEVHPNSPEATASNSSMDYESPIAEPAREPMKIIVPETSITNATPLTLPTGEKYSGYRVLVFQSPVTLADENGELFFKYGTLKEDKLADNTFGYMSGAFESEPQAREYISQVKTLFPEARILRYVNGFIIDNGGN